MDGWMDGWMDKWMVGGLRGREGQRGRRGTEMRAGLEEDSSLFNPLTAYSHTLFISLDSPGFEESLGIFLKRTILS